MKKIGFILAARIRGDINLGPGDHQISLNGVDSYIRSAGDGCILIHSKGTHESAIYFSTGAGGGVSMDNCYLILRKTDTPSVHEAGMWYQVTGDTIRYKAAAMVHILITSRGDDGLVQLPSNANLLIQGDNELRLRNALTFIRSEAENILHIRSQGNADWAIYLQTNVGGSVRILGAYLLLNSTVTPGSINGQVWYNATAHQMRCWAGNQEQRFDLTVV